jgi:malonyl-CoA O-methyltransferase
MDKPRFMPLEKRRVRESFDRAAERYDEVAVLQCEVGNRIMERLELIRLQPTTVLDLGAGTGVFTGALARRYKGARVIALDLAPRMVMAARRRKTWLSKQSFVCGDAERLPLADHCIDMIFSNLTIQWCTDLAQLFAEFRRVLRPGGVVMFSTLGPGTLKELRESWRAVDDYVHVHDFFDMHDVGDAMLRAGLADPVLDMEDFTLTYPNVYQLMRELKILGAHNAASERRHGLSGRGAMEKMAAAYERFRTNGLLPANYEVVYGHAWAGAAAGEVCIPLETLHK